MSEQTEPVRRQDSYLLRLSESERDDLEFISRSEGKLVSDKLRELIATDAKNKRNKKKR